MKKIAKRESEQTLKTFPFTRIFCKKYANLQREYCINFDRDLNAYEACKMSM